MGRACAAYEEITNIYKILVGKPQKKRPLGSSKCW
jgi:hypothetical protein